MSRENALDTFLSVTSAPRWIEGRAGRNTMPAGSLPSSARPPSLSTFLKGTVRTVMEKKVAVARTFFVQAEVDRIRLQ